MAPTPQELEQIYTEKAALAPGREAALNRLTYAETVLDIYGGPSTSDHLSQAASSLRYLDQVRQHSTYAEATNDPLYSQHNSHEQDSQFTVLAQTNLAITTATQYGHTGTVDILKERKDSFEKYATKIAEISAKEQDKNSAQAPSTATPANTEARPTQAPPTAGPAYRPAREPARPRTWAGASAATSAARSYQLIPQAIQANPGDLRRGEKAAAREWAAEHLKKANENQGTDASDVFVVNQFRTQRNETPWIGPLDRQGQAKFPTLAQNPVGDHASQALPALGNRQGNTQAGPGAQPPPASNAHETPNGHRR
ncbi:hypothetical protein [Streptomyces hokutonensis]|uniref:hypothetical protein n=1 Tax=Streptomyces hokutonensis TaxID=1306990 RepID=UPI0037F15428